MVNIIPVSFDVSGAWNHLQQGMAGVCAPWICAGWPEPGLHQAALQPGSGAYCLFVFTVLLLKVGSLGETKIQCFIFDGLYHFPPFNNTFKTLNIYSVTFEFLRLHKNSRLLPVELFLATCLNGLLEAEFR